MLEEHRLGRTYAAGMAQALERVTLGEAAALPHLRDSSRAWIELIRDHIAREDGILFEVADMTLEKPACARVCARYEHACAEKFEGRTPEQLRALADEIESASG
jgi:hemerythrin-like domain-containing protein